MSAAATVLLSSALDCDVRGIVDWLTDSNSSSETPHGSGHGIQLRASHRDAVDIRIDGTMWPGCPRWVVALGSDDGDASRLQRDSILVALGDCNNGAADILNGIAGGVLLGGCLELEFLYLPLLDDEEEDDSEDMQLNASTARKRDRDEGELLDSGACGRSPRACPSRREKAAALSSPATLRAMMVPTTHSSPAGGGGGAAKLEPLQLPPPSAPSSLIAPPENMVANRIPSPEDHTCTTTTSSTVSPVIRLRVVSPMFHPFVDESTGIFQQELAMRLLEQLRRHCNDRQEPPCAVDWHQDGQLAPPTCADPTASALGLLQLLLWVLSIPNVSTSTVLHGEDAFVSDDAMLMDAWAMHRGGQCANCAMAAALPASIEVFEQASEAEQRALLQRLKENLVGLRRNACDAVAAQLHTRQSAVASAITTYRRQRLYRAPTLFLPHSYADTAHDVVWSMLDPTLQRFFLDYGLLCGGRSGCCGTDDGVLVEHPGASAEMGDGLRSALAALCREDTAGVYSLQLLTPTACAALAQEIRTFESFDATLLPRFRPNSMNRYGLIVNEIGLKPLMTRLCRDVLFPLANLLLPQHTCEQTLDDHHSFVVEYRSDADVFLDMHSDDSEVTFNVNLLDGFKGSSLCFCGMPGTEGHRQHLRSYEHALGRVVVHAGAQRHGALPITSGERMNLIVWGRSSWYRQQHGGRAQHPRHPHEAAPDVVCLSMTHDADYYLHQKQALADTAPTTFP